MSASNGALLPWNPVAAGGRVNAMALSPDGASMVVGGAFTSINGSSNPGYGVAKVDTVAGRLLPFQINNIARNGGHQRRDHHPDHRRHHVYGAGYTFGAQRAPRGNVLGQMGGRLHQLGGGLPRRHLRRSMPHGDAVYMVSHAHYCGNVGGFPQTDPGRSTRGLAFTAGRPPAP